MTQDTKLVEPFGSEQSDVLLVPIIDVGAHIAKVTLESRRSPPHRDHVWDVWRALDANSEPVAVYILREEANEQDSMTFFSAVRKLIDAQQREHCPYLLRLIRTRAAPPVVVAAYCDVGRCEDVVALRWPTERVVEFVQELAEGVAYLHRHDVIHGTLSPFNLLIDGDFHPILAEVGWLHWRAISARPEQASRYQAYIAPEVIAGEEPSVASDIYSFGRVFQYVLTGEAPTPTPDGEPAPALTELVAHPLNVARIVRKCCATEPASRYACMEDLLADLRTWRESRPMGLAHAHDVEWGQKQVPAHKIAAAPTAPSFATSGNRSAAARLAPTPPATSTKGAIPSAGKDRAGQTSHEAAARVSSKKSGGVLGVFESIASAPRTTLARVVGVVLCLLVPVAACAVAKPMFENKNIEVLGMALSFPALFYAMLLVKMPSQIEAKQHVIFALCVSIVATWYLPFERLRGEGAKAALQGKDPAKRARALRYLSDSGFRDFRQVNLSGMDLERADLMDVDLSYANLSKANLYGARLMNATCVKTNFTETNLEGAHLRGCDLTQVVGLDSARCDASTRMDGGWACDQGRFTAQ